MQNIGELGSKGESPEFSSKAAFVRSEACSWKCREIPNGFLTYATLMYVIVWKSLLFGSQEAEEGNAQRGRDTLFPFFSRNKETNQ